jgi:uncharacterized membrane protein
MQNPQSTAKIAGHPVHPMLIPFPIAFFVGTLLADIAYLSTDDGFWFRASMWLLGIGLIMAALAAIAGVTDLMGDRRIQNLTDAWWHGGGNAVAVVLALINFYLRYPDKSTTVSGAGILLSAVVVLILLFTGWKGWEMVYRHRVGVADPER